MASYTDFNWEEFRGDTIEKRFSLTSGSGGPALQPASISEIWFTAKRRESDADADAVFQKKYTDGGIAASDGPNGIYEITVLPADTSSLTQRTILYCDIQVKLTDSTITTVLSGMLTLKPDITRATS
jgi:hypothetical protein